MSPQCTWCGTFQLRTCLGRRARRTQRDLASEWGKAPETGVHAGGTLRAEMGVTA